MWPAAIASRPGAPRRRRVADVARPGLEVAGVVAAGAAAATASGTPSCAHSARQCASSRVGVGAQPVVDVQGGDAAAPAARPRRAGRWSRARRRAAPRTGAPARAAAPVARDRARAAASAAPHSSAGAREEQLGHSENPLSRTSPMRLELEVRAGRVDDRPRDEHLAARRARRDARGLVDLAPVVVAVAVERLAVVDADARQRALGRAVAWKPTAQSVERGRVRADDHHLVADRLDDARVVGQRVLDRLDEALDRGHAPPPRPAPRSCACSRRGRRRRSPRAGGPRSSASSSRSASMWPMTSCSTKCCRKRWCRWSMIGEASGSSSRGEPLHLLGHLEPGDAVAHQRLVHVEVEQAHLGVGDLGQRLAVDAHELQEGDEREAGGEHGRRRSAAAGGRPRSEAWSRRRAEADRLPDALDQGGLEPGLARRRPRACTRRPRTGTGPRRSRRRARPFSAAWRIEASECPRSRSRATMRAVATAAGVQPPLALGITP